MSTTHEVVAAQAFAEAALALISGIKNQIECGQRAEALTTLDQFESLLQSIGGGL